MGNRRLLCSVIVPSDQTFPDDDHPYWRALEALGDAVAESARARGLDPNEFEAMSESEDGSMLTISSDAPSWAMRFWIYLPADGAVQAELLPILLEHLSEARSALPDAAWDLTFSGQPLAWDGEQFRFRS